MQKTLTYILFGLTCLFLISGCITKRGHGLNTGNLVQGADGIWRLKSHTNQVRTPPPKITQPIPKSPPAVISPPLSKPVEFPPARVRPTPAEPKSAVPHPSPVTVKPSPAKFPPFQPSISSTKNVNVRPATLPTEENNVDNSSQESNIEEETVVINWTELGMFYLIIILLAIAGWLGYDTWRERQAAEERLATAKKTAKKPAKKKKAAKKKVVKKKKLDTKNQRKSTQATRKKPKSP